MRISDWSSDVCSSDLRIFVARRADEVIEVLEAADKARRESGGTLAGYIAYEAGLGLEQRLFPLADQRSGAMGPLVWPGRFGGARALAAAGVPAWLDARAGTGGACRGPAVARWSGG